MLLLLLFLLLREPFLAIKEKIASMHSVHLVLCEARDNEKGRETFLLYPN